MSTTLFPLQYLRQNANPIDVDSVFTTTAARIAYLANGRRYPGQVVSDLQENKVYVLDNTAAMWLEISNGGVLPGGVCGSVQWNGGSGQFCGNSGFTYDPTYCRIGASSLTNTNSLEVRVGNEIQDSWVSEYGDGSYPNFDIGTGTVLDSSGNTVAVGYSTGAPRNVFVAKYSSTGTIIWQINLTEINAYAKASSFIGVDSADNIYLGVDVSAITTSILVKLDSTGAIIWQREIADYSMRCGAVDGSDNIILSGASTALPSPYPAVIIVYDGSGSLQWQKAITPASGSLTPKAVAVDSAGSITTVGSWTDGVDVYTNVTALTSAGATSWSTDFIVDCGSASVAADSSGNTVIAAAAYGGGGNLDLWLIKLDTAGVKVWETKLDYGSPLAFGVGIAISGSTIYTTTGFGGMAVQAWTALGALSWNRLLTSPGKPLSIWTQGANVVEAAGFVSVVGTIEQSAVPTGSAMVVSRLPSDGSGSGTYGGYTYFGVSNTNSTPVTVSAAGGLTIVAGSVVQSPGSFFGSAAAVVVPTLTGIDGIAAWYFSSGGATVLPGYSLPAADGSSGQALVTDGTGCVGWQSVVVDPATPTSLGTVFGYTTGSGNTSIGCCAGNTTQTGVNNIAIGFSALAANSGGCNNVAQGFNALCSNTYGGSNIAIGEFAIASNITGDNNIGIGYAALYGNTIGSNNTGLGFSSLSQNTTGVHNVAIGCYSLASNTGGFQNVAIGRGAMCVNTTGYSNVAVGPFNLVNNTAGYGNVAVGYGSLCTNTAGAYNIALGFRGLYCNTEGSSNISIGSQTLFQNTTGAANIAVGASALGNNMTGSCNIAIGYRALRCNLSGNYNIAQGYYAAFRNCGSCNIAHGFNALYGNTTGNLNIAIGICAGCNITTGSNNTVIGSLSAAAACVCTVLIGAGTCERVKVDNTGLYINNVRSIYDLYTTITGATGVVTHDASTGTIFRHTGIAANFTANVTNLNLGSGQTANIVLILVQGVTPYIANALQIGGVAQTINWQGGSAPAGTANKLDIITFSMFNAGGTYTVLGQLVSFG